MNFNAHKKLETMLEGSIGYEWNNNGYVVFKLNIHVSAVKLGDDDSTIVSWFQAVDKRKGQNILGIKL